MEKIRIKTLAASMESALHSESELPDLRSPLCIAMEDADVLKAVLAVAAVGALFAAVGYAAYKAGEWLGLQIGGSSSGGSSGYVSSQSASVNNIYTKHQNGGYSDSDIEIELVGFTAYVLNGKAFDKDLDRAIELIPHLLITSAEWLKGQGSLIADAVSKNSTNPDDYRLNSQALSRLIGEFTQFFSKLKRISGHITDVVELKHVYSETMSNIHNAKHKARSHPSAWVNRLKGLNEHLAIMESEVKKFDEATLELKREFDSMGEDMKKLSEINPEVSREIKAILNETNRNLQAGLALSTSIYAFFGQVAKDAGKNARIIDSALNQVRKQS